MRQLLLMRHAKSSWDDPTIDDFERPLNRRGQRAARLMADGLAEIAPRPDLVLVSAARRTRETYRLLAPRLTGVAVETEDSLYEAGASELLRRLRRLDDRAGCVLLIGHNPGLERLAFQLTSGKGDPDSMALMARKFPTGTLAHIALPIDRWADIVPDIGQLENFVRPKDLGEAGDED